MGSPHIRQIFLSGCRHSSLGQTIVQNGPYRWVRHPAYTGSILTLIGFALGLTLIASLVILVICFVGFLYRIQVEEKALVEVFGKEYQEYMQRTWRLFQGSNSSNALYLFFGDNATEHPPKRPDTGMICERLIHH